MCMATLSYVYMLLMQTGPLLKGWTDIDRSWYYPRVSDPVRGPEIYVLFLRNLPYLITCEYTQMQFILWKTIVIQPELAGQPKTLSITHFQETLQHHCTAAAPHEDSQPQQK